MGEKPTWWLGALLLVAYVWLCIFSSSPGKCTVFQLLIILILLALNSWVNYGFLKHVQQHSYQTRSYNIQIPLLFDDLSLIEQELKLQVCTVQSYALRTECLTRFGKIHGFLIN